MSEVPEKADVIIVGGGVAGLYCAWRLLHAHPDKKIILFERYHRIGGRLQTDIIEVDGQLVKEEEGGMRFQKSQLAVCKLIKLLGFYDKDIIPFSMGDENNRYYLRGRSFTVKEITDSKNKIWSEIYKLDELEKNQNAADILKGVMDNILSENNLDPVKHYPKTIDDWRDFRLNMEWKKKKIYQWGFWSLLIDYGLSQECITMLHDTQGFVGPYIQLVNAGIALQLLGDFPNNPEFFALKLGFGELPKTLAEKIKEYDKPDSPVIREGCVVDSFDLKDDKYEVNVTIKNKSQKFLCDKIILALPKFPLEKLAETSPKLGSNTEFLKGINGVVSMFLSKINFYYHHRWWFRDFKLRTGGSYTDLPIDQLYCFRPLDNEDDPQRPSAITLYCSDFKGNYWYELQSMGKPYHTKEFPVNPPNMLPASTAVVDQAWAQLKIMFGTRNIPKPVLTSFRRWAVDAAGSAYHQWRIGANDEELVEKIWNPATGVYVCGEAFSDAQAWVEGALRSAEKVLTDKDGFSLVPLADLS